MEKTSDVVINKTGMYDFVDRNFIIEGEGYFPAMIHGVWKIIPSGVVYMLKNNTKVWPDFGEFDSAESAITFAMLRAD